MAELLDGGVALDHFFNLHFQIKQGLLLFHLELCLLLLRLRVGFDIVPKICRTPLNLTGGTRQILSAALDNTARIT